MNSKFPEHILELQNHGDKCLKAILAILEDWPVGEYCRRIEFDIRTAADKQFIRKALKDFEGWVKALAIQRAIHDQRKFTELIRTLRFAVLKEDYKDNAIDDGLRVRAEFSSLVSSMPMPGPLSGDSNMNEAGNIQKGTAFIIMAMGEMPELQDTCLTIKRVCTLHGFRAFRADDILHGGVIINRIYESIATAELLIGDLTLEMPNVYYEIGIAQGQSKEPILFRKRGAKLHFDLASHNVPEYRNFAELESLLTTRLKAFRQASS